MQVLYDLVYLSLHLPKPTSLPPTPIKVKTIFDGLLPWLLFLWSMFTSSEWWGYTLMAISKAHFHCHMKGRGRVCLDESGKNLCWASKKDNGNEGLFFWRSEITSVKDVTLVVLKRERQQISVQQNSTCLTTTGLSAPLCTSFLKQINLSYLWCTQCLKQAGV